MKVSIITINLNNAIGLRKTLESSFAQKYNDFEQIVIDGNSTDNSKNIIEEYKDKIAYAVSATAHGIYEAMNKGIRVARGEYLIFMNSGDVFYNTDILSTVLHRNYNTDYIFGDMMLDCGNKKVQCSIPRKLTFYHLYTHTLYHQSMFVRKDVFEKYGYYDETLKITADWKQYLIALFKHNCSYTLLPEILAMNQYAGISSLRQGTKEIILKERQQALETYFPGFIEDYQTLHSLKRITPKGLIRGLKRRYFEFITK